MTVVVTVVQGKNIKGGDLMSKADPYIIVDVGGFTQQTRRFENESNPVWNETFEFNYVGGLIVFQLWDDDGSLGSSYQGEAAVDPTAFLGINQQLTLQLKNPKYPNMQQGDLDVQISYSGGVAPGGLAMAQQQQQQMYAQQQQPVIVQQQQPVIVQQPPVIVQQQQPRVIVQQQPQVIRAGPTVIVQQQGGGRGGPSFGQQQGFGRGGPSYVQQPGGGRGGPSYVQQGGGGRGGGGGPVGFQQGGGGRGGGGGGTLGRGGRR